jgi:hypothetical protein
MSPWEVREHVNFLLAEAAPNQAVTGDVARAAARFTHGWRAIWAAHGEGESGWPAYQALLDVFVRELAAVRAQDLLLVNEVDFFECIRSMVVEYALTGRARTAAKSLSPRT